MGIFDSSNTSKTTFKPSAEQAGVLSSALPYIQQFARQGIRLPTTSGVADFNPTQLAAQQQALGAAADQTQLGQQGAGFSSDLFSGMYLDPNTNPALQGTIDAATRPIFEGLSQQIMPQIRGEARSTGNFGSSKQGIAEGLAAQGALRSAGDVASGISYQGYQQGLNAMMQNLGLLPRTQDALTSGAATTGAVGDAIYGNTQAKLTEQQDRFMQQQLLPIAIGQELLAALGAIPGGTTISKQNTSASPFSQVAGAGLTLASLL